MTRAALAAVSALAACSSVVADVTGHYALGALTGLAAVAAGIMYRIRYHGAGRTR